MKRLIIVAAVFLLAVGFNGVCRAGSIGPMEPLGPMKVATTVEYNGVYNKDLAGSGAATGGEVTQNNQVYAQVNLGLNDWSNAYLRLGAANLEHEISWNNGINQTIKYDYGFLWGLGANAKHDLGNNFGLGGDTQFNMWFTDADAISGNNNPTFIDKGSLKNYEFQTAVYIMYDYDVELDAKITPYLGGYYSYFRSDISDSIKFQDNTATTYTVGDIKSDDNFGILAGLNVTATENLYFKLEGRFLAETAFSAGMTYKY